MRITLLFFALLSLFVSPSTKAVVHQNPILTEPIKSLKVGNSLFAISSQYREVDQFFSTTGQSRDLGFRQSREIRWSDLIRYQSTPQERDQLMVFLKEKGIGTDEVAIRSKMRVETAETRFHFRWLYGMSSFWTLGAQLPLISQKSKSSVDVQKTQSYARAFESSGDSDQQSEQQKASMQSLSQKIKDYPSSQLAEMGYDSKEEVLFVGDVDIISHIRLFQAPQWRFATRQELSVPVSPQGNSLSLLTQDSNQGQFDTGVSLLADYLGWTGFEVSIATGYRIQWMDRVTFQIPKAEAGQQADNTDREIHRDAGDIFWWQLQPKYFLSDDWAVRLSYRGQMKGQDKYEGQFGTRSYDFLEVNSDHEIQVLGVGIDFNPRMDSNLSIQGLSGWSAQVSYHHLLTGRNAVSNGYALLDLAIAY